MDSTIKTSVLNCASIVNCATDYLHYVQTAIFCATDYLNYVQTAVLSLHYDETSSMVCKSEKHRCKIQ